MSSKANHFKLGVFVITGVLLVLAALLLFGIGQSLRKPLLVETYLDQSVQGLEVGSSVKFRGVDFGTVHEIGFSRDRYEFGKPVAQQRRYILIEIAVHEDAYRAHGREGFRDFLKTEVERGLRLRLNAQGITGLSLLELDYVEPRRTPSLEIGWTPENPYIPSAPGTLTKLLTAAEQVFRKLEAVDLGLIATNLNRVLVAAEGEIRAAQVGRISEQVTNLVAELRESNRALRRVLEDPQWQEIPETAVATLKEVRTRVERLPLEATLLRLDRALGSAESFLAGKESDLASTLANLRALSENLRALSEMAKAHPSALLLGAPPKPVQDSR